MKITIEKDDGTVEVHDAVSQFAMSGIKGGVEITDFHSYTGQYKHLMEKTHSLHELLKQLFLLNEIKVKK